MERDKGRKLGKRMTELRKVEKSTKKSNCSTNKKNETGESKEKIGLRKEARTKLMIKYSAYTLINTRIIQKEDKLYH